MQRRAAPGVRDSTSQTRHGAHERSGVLRTESARAATAVRPGQFRTGQRGTHCHPAITLRDREAPGSNPGPLTTPLISGHAFPGAVPIP